MTTTLLILPLTVVMLVSSPIFADDYYINIILILIVGFWSGAQVYASTPHGRMAHNYYYYCYMYDMCFICISAAALQRSPFLTPAPFPLLLLLTAVCSRYLQFCFLLLENITPKNIYSWQYLQIVPHLVHCYCCCVACSGISEFLIFFYERPFVVLLLLLLLLYCGSSMRQKRNSDIWHIPGNVYTRYYHLSRSGSVRAIIRVTNPN